jgi:hypothetical protein
MTMDTTDGTTHSIDAPLAGIGPKSMGFARLVQNLANRFKGLARALTVTGLLSGLLLAWFATRAWGLSVTVAVILGVVLILPGLVLGWCWYVLDEASSLPQRLTAWLSRAGGYAGGVHQRLQGEEDQAEGKARVSDIKKLAGLAYEVASMGIDSRDLMSIFGGSLSLANPVFLIVLAVSAVLIVLLDIGAVIAGLFAWL